MTATAHTSCRICHSPLPPAFLSLGPQPLANNLYDDPKASVSAPRYPLDLHYCATCGLVQLGCVVDPHLLFDEYLYVPSTSAAFRKHFKEMAEHVSNFVSYSPTPLVVDIGSNDGLFLGYCKEMGASVVGVEPAGNLSNSAAQRGIPTLNEFFSLSTVHRIRRNYGGADLVTATNVFAHCADLHKFVDAVSVLLNPTGTFVLEVPGWLEQVIDGTWDMTYHEHLSYLSIRPLLHIFFEHGLRITRVEEIPTHGGSIRVYVDKRTQETPDPSVEVRLAAETDCGLDTDIARQNFAKRAEQTRRDLAKLLTKHGPVFGYGAPAKATVLTNYCDWGLSEVRFIVDDNPAKQGKYLPGTEIRIEGSECLKRESLPQTALIYPWTISEDILPKLAGVVDQAIIPLPSPRVVPVSIPVPSS